MKKKIMPLDLFFSIIIIISILSIITIITLEIRAYSQSINAKTEASIIASNILENMKTRSYDDVEKYLSEISYVGITKKIENNIQYINIYGSEFTEKFFGTEIPENYVIEFKSENLHNDFNISKKITIIVNYTVNRKADKLEVSTLIEKENVNECNYPIISDEYFSEFGITSKEFEIIPIKYSEENKCYVTTNTNDADWFNYSVKRWAKVIIFSKKDDRELRKLFIDNKGNINFEVEYENEKINLGNYIYVWIPNFSIKDDITYFRYGTSKKIIKMDFSYTNGKYLYSNKIGEEIKDISKDCSFDGIYGVWKKYGQHDDIYYSNFNETKYAPINMY